MREVSPRSLQVILFVLCLAGLSLSDQEHTVCVSLLNQTNSSCRSLDEALRGIETNSFLQLQQGTHVVQSDYNISSKANLTIIGNPANPSSVVIECDDSYGLIFLKIEQLKMSGFTLAGCGFTGIDRVMGLFSSIREEIELFFHPLYFFSTGILLFDIQDLVLENAVIKENEGFGMVAINVIGESRLSGVHFISNFPNAQSVCNLEVTTDPGGSGGGLFLMYHDYINQSKNERAENSSLFFNNGFVQSNYNCRRDPYLTQYSRLTRSLLPLLASNMSIVGSGGVTLSLGQTHYSFSASFENCNFSNNTGLYSNSALEILVYNDTDKSEVRIQNSIFEKNGGLFYNTTFSNDGLDLFGALGVAFFTPITISNSDAAQPLRRNPAIITIVNCSFVENIAVSGAGVTVFSFSTTHGFVNDLLTIQGCEFQNNTGNFGSAIYITELSYSAFESSLGIILDSIRVQSNKALLGSLSSTQPFLSDTVSTIDISNVRVSFKGNSLFDRNSMTAVSTNNAILEMSGFARFSENSGITGGALHLERESYLILVNRTELEFERNSAQLAGGAIFVKVGPVRATTYDCYLFFERVDFYCGILNPCPRPNNRYIIKFFNNTSPLGSTSYGANLFDCPWNNSAFNIINATFRNNYTSLDLDPNLLILLDDPPISVNGINTLALAIFGRTAGQNLTTSTDQEVEPGQQFSIPLVAYDRLLQAVPLTISSVIDNPQATSSVSTSNRFLLTGGEEEFTTVPLRVNGTRGESYNVTITSTETLLLSQFTVSVSLKNCSLGFVYNEFTRSCECEIDRSLVGVECNNDGSISFPENQWIGMVGGDYVQGSCILDYCEVGVTRIFLSEPDTQCRNNRSGVLCGQCAEGHSRITGASFCDLCESNNFLALIVLFAAFGIFLVVILGLFNITITDGLINGFVFYANIFSVYTSTFLPVTDIRGAPGFVLISFLNLNFGIQSCFYVGMTELDLVGLTLIFPIYLMFILLVITLIGTWVTHERVSHFFQRINVTHIFATILFYSYASVMDTCVTILAGLSVEIDQVRTGTRWGKDPNVEYGIDPVHGILVAVSLILLVVLVPLPIILLIPQISFRVRFVRKFKPVIDAFIAPFAPQKSFWISFRLVFRVVIYIIAASGVSSEQLVSISVLITVMTLIQAYLKPFNLPSRNLIDTFLMINLTVYSIIAIYTSQVPSSKVEEAMIIMFVFMYLFSFLVLLLFTHYILKRFECTNKPYTKATNLLITALEKVKNYLQNPYCCCSGKMGDSDANHVDEPAFNTAVTHTSVNLRSDVLRESLLELVEERPTPPKKSTNSRRTDDTLL